MKVLSKSPKLWWLCLIPIFIGILLIWIGLGVRPLHHDESLHAIYGLYYYLDPDTQYYKYNPMLHGPLLYHLLPWVYHFFDETYQSIRLIPAALFTMLPLILAYILRARLGLKSLLLAAILITGPSYIYWARFLRHDQLVFFQFLIMGMAFLPKFKKYSAYFFLIPFSLQFCTKENAYIHLAFFIGYIIFDFFIRRKNLFLIDKILKYKKHFFTSSIISILIYTYYYSGGFNYSEGIFDGLYRKSLFYWINQHHVERISGPFLTQFFTLFWYELPFLLFLIFTIFHLHWKKNIFLRSLPFVLLSIAGLFHYSYGSTISNLSLWSQIAKVKIGLDFYAFFFLFPIAISGTWVLIKSKERSKPFFYYWTMASFFTYSFLGEKVPWLSLYILIPGQIFLLFYWKELRVKIMIPVILIFLIFNSYQAFKLNLKYSGSEKEFISQVHTTKEYDQLAQKLQLLLQKDSKLKILSLKDNTWPLSWHLYKRQGYYLKRRGRDLEEFDIILDTFPSKKQLPSHQKKIIKLRHWWVPNWNEISLKNTLIYAFTHEPWSSSGAQKITVYYKKGLLDF